MINNKYAAVIPWFNKAKPLMCQLLTSDQSDNGTMKCLDIGAMVLK